MKKLLVITAIFEGLTGLGLVTIPSLLSNILLGEPITENVGIVVAMVAGSALLSISVSCWLSRASTNATALIKSLLVYNITVAAVLIYGALVFRINGLGLWPATIAHIALAIWCIMLLLKKTVN
jgi:hypothetical protein